MQLDYLYEPIRVSGFLYIQPPLGTSLEKERRSSDTQPRRRTEDSGKCVYVIIEQVWQLTPAQLYLTGSNLLISPAGDFEALQSVTGATAQVKKMDGPISRALYGRSWTSPTVVLFQVQGRNISNNIEKSEPSCPPIFPLPLFSI